ncbi:hypothetical protein H2248_009062 [Termitomyces sp. 'cryptogamus']|nr:hypothetical protein H2248_009062 [Termitomyces sp. 'cryptogamus']
MRAASGIPGVGRAGSPSDTGRVVSMPNLDAACNGGDTDGEYLPSSPSSTSSPSPPLTGLTPQHTGTIGTITPQTTGSTLALQYTGSRESGRATSSSFASALELARKVEAGGQIEASLRPAVASGASVKTSTCDGKESSTSITSVPAPPSSVLDHQEKVDVAPAQHQVLSPSDTTAPSDEPASVSEPAIPPQLSTPSIVLSPSDERLKSLVISAAEESVPEVVTVSASRTLISAKPNMAQPENELTGLVSPVITSAPNTIITTESKFVELVNDKLSLSLAERTASSSTTGESELSPLGPFSLVNAVHDLGKVVANIQDMFPGQISPLAAPPSYRPLVIEPPSTSQEPKILMNTKKSIPDLELKLDTRSEATPAVPRPTTRVPVTLSVTKPTEMLTSPQGRNARPASMFAASPSQPATRITSTTVPTPESQRSGTTPNKHEYFPPTPEPEVSEFGKGREISHSLSHTQVSLEQGTSTGSFSAVVHKKVTELPTTTTTTSYLGVYAKVSETPKKSSELEPVTSPGYGELAELLHEAALLEFSLEHGELPGEGAKKAGIELEKKERQGEMKEGEEMGKQAVVKAEEEKKKHATMAKAHVKQEASASESKSVFRNPLLRSRSAQRRDESADSEARKEKSVTLSFRPLPELPFFQSTSTPLAITPIPEKEVVPADATARDAEIKSPAQTSPRSLRYFTSLKRFASSSKTSLTSSSQPRDSVSASSEMSEDWSVIPTPAENGGEIENKNGLFNGPGIGWPVLSPKKSSGVGRSASFTDRIFNRNRKTSTVSSVSDANSAYEAIDRLAKSKAGKSAASLIPPLDPVSFTLDVPIIQENDQLLPSPPDLVSPRRSASLYVPSTSQFPPIFSARPTNSVGEDKLASPDFTSPTGPPQQSIDVIFSAKPTSPVYTPHRSSSLGVGVPTQWLNANTTNEQPSSLDAALFSVKPTSPVYTPHAPALAMRSQETITDSPTLLSSLKKETESPNSWMSDISMESSTSSIPSPLFDSFPSVPQEMPLPPALAGRQRNFNKPSLPLPAAPSFFESAPTLSSSAIGAEFLAGPSPFAKSAVVKSDTVASGEHCRS